MTTKSEYSGNGKLALGNGSHLPITHIGNFHLPTSRSLSLRNILLVPSLTKNLISISKFTLEIMLLWNLTLLAAILRTSNRKKSFYKEHLRMASTSCTCLGMIFVLITSYHRMQAQLHYSLNNALGSIQFFLPMKRIIQL